MTPLASSVGGGLQVKIAERDEVGMATKFSGGALGATAKREREVKEYSERNSSNG